MKEVQYAQKTRVGEAETIKLVLKGLIKIYGIFRGPRIEAQGRGTLSTYGEPSTT